MSCSHTSGPDLTHTAPAPAPCTRCQRNGHDCESRYMIPGQRSPVKREEFERWQTQYGSLPSVASNAPITAQSAAPHAHAVLQYRPDVSTAHTARFLPYDQTTARYRGVPGPPYGHMTLSRDEGHYVCIGCSRPVRQQVVR